MLSMHLHIFHSIFQYYSVLLVSQVVSPYFYVIWWLEASLGLNIYIIRTNISIYHRDCCRPLFCQDMKYISPIILLMSG